MDTKICLTCKETLDISAFTKRSNRKENDYQPHCNKCRSLARNERSRNLKAKAIEYKGGKCNDCLQVVHQAAFEFHHLNPDTKADKDPAHFGVSIVTGKQIGRASCRERVGLYV